MSSKSKASSATWWTLIGLLYGVAIGFGVLGVASIGFDYGWPSWDYWVFAFILGGGTLGLLIGLWLDYLDRRKPRNIYSPMQLNAVVILLFVSILVWMIMSAPSVRE
jgi:hypothetical protein